MGYSGVYRNGKANGTTISGLGLYYPHTGESKGKNMQHELENAIIFGFRIYLEDRASFVG